MPNFLEILFKWALDLDGNLATACTTSVQNTSQSLTTQISTSDAFKAVLFFFFFLSFSKLNKYFLWVMSVKRKYALKNKKHLSISSMIDTWQLCVCVCVFSVFQPVRVSRHDEDGAGLQHHSSSSGRWAHPTHTGGAYQCTDRLP